MTMLELHGNNWNEKQMEWEAKRKKNNTYAIKKVGVSMYNVEFENMIK